MPRDVVEGDYLHLPVVLSFVPLMVIMISVILEYRY